MTHSPWDEAAAALATEFADGAYELRCSLHGRAAVRMRTCNGAVAARHAEAPVVPAPWSMAVRCGEAAAWLVADRPPNDVARAGGILARALDRHAALELQRLGAREAAMQADLLEVLTHRLRTDVSTMQAVAEGALAGVFEQDERDEVGAEIAAVGSEAQRRVAAAREVMSTLAARGEEREEPILRVLSEELEIAGVRAAVRADKGEEAMARVPGAGWAACARRVARALRTDERLGAHDARLAIEPDPSGWRLTVGPDGRAAGEVQWSRHTLGELVHAGEILTAAGGDASAVKVDGGGLRITFVIPAAPSP